MNPITHALASWLLGDLPAGTTRRERVLVTVGGLIPDLDGLGAVPDLVTRWAGWTQTSYYHDYHRLLHTALFAGVTTALAGAAAPRGARARTAALACAAFHLHLLCDAAGSRGPDGSQWPIPYLWPFSAAIDGMWSWQWRLDGWQNVALTLALLVVMAVVAVRRGRSALEVVSPRADGAVVETLRRRFGKTEAA